MHKAHSGLPLTCTDPTTTCSLDPEHCQGSRHCITPELKPHPYELFALQGHARMQMLQAHKHRLPSTTDTPRCCACHSLELSSLLTELLVITPGYTASQDRLAMLLQKHGCASQTIQLQPPRYRVTWRRSRKTALQCARHVTAGHAHTRKPKASTDMRPRRSHGWPSAHKA